MSFSSRLFIRVLMFIIAAIIVWQIIKIISREAPKEDVMSKEQDILKLEDAHFNNHRQNKIKIKVFYEALCPDSRHFIIHNLLNVAENLAEYTTISLVPFGKASTTRTNEGKFEFQCQHGPTECYANMIHACAIEALPNDTQAVEMVSCMISNNADPDAALVRCSKTLGFPATQIETCAKGERGSELLNMFGEETKPLEPLSFVPTIELNGSLDNQMAILKNLNREVCKLIGMPLPPACLS